VSISRILQGGQSEVKVVLRGRIGQVRGGYCRNRGEGWRQSCWGWDVRIAQDVRRLRGRRGATVGGIVHCSRKRALL